MNIREKTRDLKLKITELLAHASNYTKAESRTVQYLVVHYTGNSMDLAINNAKYFSGYNRQASAHFFVDDVDIYQSVPLNCVAWHCGDTKYKHEDCRNSNSIGIEMCCSGDYKVSETTKDHAVKLIVALCKQMGISHSEVDTYILRHYDITGKNCPAQMAGSGNAEWEEFKDRIKAALGGTKPAKTETKTEEAKQEVCEVNLPVLRKGDEGNSVKALQSILIVAGYNCGGYGADGDFGNGTYKSVKEYQQANGLDVDGIVGTQTWTALLK